jgi:hypothetical protein
VHVFCRGFPCCSKACSEVFFLLCRTVGKLSCRRFRKPPPVRRHAAKLEQPCPGVRTCGGAASLSLLRDVAGVLGAAASRCGLRSAGGDGAGRQRPLAAAAPHGGGLGGGRGGAEAAASACPTTTSTWCSGSSAALRSGASQRRDVRLGVWSAGAATPGACRGAGTRASGSECGWRAGQRGAGGGADRRQDEEGFACAEAASGRAAASGQAGAAGEEVEGS